MSQITLENGIAVCNAVLEALGQGQKRRSSREAAAIYLGVQLTTQLIVAALCRSAGVPFMPVVEQLDLEQTVKDHGRQSLPIVLGALQLTDNHKLNLPTAPDVQGLDMVTRVLAQMVAHTKNGPPPDMDPEELVTDSKTAVEYIQIGSCNVAATLAAVLAEQSNRTVMDVLRQCHFGDMPPDLIRSTVHMAAVLQQDVRERAEKEASNADHG